MNQVSAVIRFRIGAGSPQDVILPADGVTTDDAHAALAAHLPHIPAAEFTVDAVQEATEADVEGARDAAEQVDAAFAERIEAGEVASIR